jgi:hypothetical protein
MANAPTPRQHRPRAPVAMRPSFVSQENCAAILGVNARRYLERVVPRCKDRVISVGKLRLIAIDDAEAALRGLAASAGTSSDDEGDEPQERQPQTTEEVLAMLGLERTK